MRRASGASTGVSINTTSWSVRPARQLSADWHAASSLPITCCRIAPDRSHAARQGRNRASIRPAGGEISGEMGSNRRTATSAGRGGFPSEIARIAHVAEPPCRYGSVAARAALRPSLAMYSTRSTGAWRKAHAGAWARNHGSEMIRASYRAALKSNFATRIARSRCWLALIK